MSSPSDTAVAAAPPASVAQEALWYTSLLDPNRVSYNETVSIRKEGPLDPEALRRAFAEIVRRHEAWRTTFDVVDGIPVQVVVQPSPQLDLPLVDLSELDAEEAERRAVRLAAETSRVPYDLRRGPLVRPRLVRFSADEHRLYLSMHHIVFDGVSVYRVVLPELIALYDAFAAGEESPLDEPEASYADYARWEQEWIEGDRAARRLSYWHEHLAGYVPLALPTDRPRPSEPRYRGGVAPLTVPADLVSRLRTVGQGAGTTLFSVLAAAWAALLSRYSGQDDVVFATPADLRQRPEFMNVVGYCLTPLVARVDLSGDPSFGELLTRVRNEVLDALDNAVPFERVVRALDSESAGGGNPVYQSMIVLEPAVAEPAPGWSSHLMENEITRAVDATKLDLELQVDERPDGHLAGRLIYDRDLFKAATAERLADRWTRILAAVAADPGVTISSLAGATGAEERRQFVEWNATATGRPPSTVHELVRERCAAQPDAIAVSTGEETLTYAELDARSDAAAAELRAAGTEAGDVVPLSDEPSVEMIVAALASLKAGGADSPCAIQLTRTGKAVAVSHQAAVNVAIAVADELGLNAADTVLSLPSRFSVVPAIALWAPLIAGVKLVLPPADDLDGTGVSRLVRKQKVTLLHASPDEWQALVDSGLRAGRSLRALSSGAALPEELAEEILALCRVLWNVYGSAETAGCATIGRIEPPTPVVVGRPISNMRIYVVDDDGGPVPIGAIGELLVAGDAMATEYINRPDLNDASFIEAPPEEGRLFRTGDSGRWLPAGVLQVVTPPAE